MKHLNTLEKAEAKKESKETQEMVELAEVEVIEEEVELGMEKGKIRGRVRRLGS